MFLYKWKLPDLFSPIRIRNYTKKLNKWKSNGKNKIKKLNEMIKNNLIQQTQKTKTNVNKKQIKIKKK